MDRWCGKVALVTGASVGIGAAICRELVKHGIRVVGCARNSDKIAEIGAEDAVQSASGTLHPYRCDLRTEENILSMFQFIKDEYGRIDICINNAGLSVLTSMQSGTTESWKTMLDVNVMGLCICTREALQLMKQAGVDDGQIIHISSMAGYRLIPRGNFFYAGTKHMVRVLAEGLRSELRVANSRIRVSCISPGMVDTEFHIRQHGDQLQENMPDYHTWPYIKSEDIAQAVITILQAPPHIDINDILIRPSAQVF